MTTLLRVMSFNVHACRGVDRRVDPARIAAIIRQERPDVVALQELFVSTPLRHGDQLSSIADRLKMDQVFCETVKNGTVRYGHALLSKWPLVVQNRERLPGADGSEPRAALWARVEHRDGPLQLITTHLALRKRERVMQAHRLMGASWVAAAAREGVVLLAGDLNGRPRGAAHQVFSEGLRDVWHVQRRAWRRRGGTWPAPYPLVTLDYIFASPSAVVERAWVSRAKGVRLASDHRPVLAELRLA